MTDKKHEHNFVPLNDHAIYCAGCGEINSVPACEHRHVCAPCTQPHYYWWSTPSTIQPPYTITTSGTSGSVVIGNTTTYDSSIPLTYTMGGSQ